MARKREPRKSRKNEPITTIGEVVPQLQEILESRQEKAALDSPVEQPPPEQEAPQQPEPARRQKSWGETVRSWESYGDTGVHRVTTTSPDMTGIRYDDDRKRTDAEKVEMEGHGLKYFNEPRAWLKSKRNGGEDETMELAERIAARRRQDEGVGR